MRSRRLLVAVRGSLLSAALCWGGGGGASGQTAGQVPAADATPADAPRVVAGLSTRFRFHEHYERGLDKSRPGAIDQYRVATRDTLKAVTEKPNGAPDRAEQTRQSIYAERPAEVETGGTVGAVVRHYEAFRSKPDPAARPARATPLEGLTLWYEPKDGQLPQVLSLTPGRGLREEEYTAAAIREIFVPSLAALLPISPSRTGDRWTISRAGILGLLGVPPAGRGGTLSGTLQEVRQSAKGPSWEAVIGVTGRVPLPSGDTGVNARLIFEFPAPKADPAEAEKELVEARGAVVDLRMATSVTTALGPNSRLRRILTRELVLVRQLAETGDPLTVPDSTPAATEENSWLTYDDPQGKFHFRYPQEFRIGRQPDDFSIELARFRSGRPDTLELRRVVKSGDAQADRLNRDPEMHAKVNTESWRQDGFDVIAGQHAWLPDADWADAKRKVYRAESVLRAIDPATKRQFRLTNELFFVQFGREESLVVIATTGEDPPAPFRKQVEAIIKSYDFGTSPAK